MSQLHKSTSGLSPAESRALLASMLRKRANQPRAVPVSYAQRRLWFLDQLDRDSAAYNIPQAVRLSGALDVAALARAFSEIVRRHETLRTTFTAVDGDPRQLIHPPAELSLPVHDLSEWPARAQQAEVERLAGEDARRRFDLRLGPLMRISLVKLGPNDHVLLLSLHHIVSDGWSMQLFINELETLYSAFSAGEPSPLPELPIQYADYAQWQRRWLNDGVLDEQLSHWRSRLKGARPFISFPASHPRPTVQTFRGAAQSLKFSSELSAAIKALSHGEGATLFMTLLAAFNVLLYRYTGQEDVLVGTPIANRGRGEIEGLIGLFANTLVLRTDLSGDPTFQESLGRVREVALAAYANQDLPFEKLVEELQPERNLSYPPLFQVMFLLQNASSESSAQTGLALEPVGSRNLTAKFDVTLSIQDSEQGLSGAIEYNSDLYEAAAIARLATHFQTLLGSIAANAEQRISELPLLSEDERQQLLVEWNETRAEYPDACVHQLFEQQAAQQPNALAVMCGDVRLTYGELNERANQLAHYLKSLGVGAESLVGVSLERSAEMVVALLGTLKAGAAYLPLDPEYPEERLRYMIEDAGAAVVLTREHLTRIDTQPKENPHIKVQPENLAYVLYTSGSTGSPKGTLITHRGLVNYLHWAINAYQVAEGQGAPLHSPIVFDLTVTSLFAPLLTGRKVILLPEDSGVDALADALLAHRNFSLVKLTPAHLDILNEQLSGTEVAGRTRALVIGGEALVAETVSFWREHAPETRLINEYGPTETVVGCCVYEVSDADPWSGPVPIGYPIANTQLYILGERMEPLPIGVPGELYIGGDGLARGYINRPDLTAEKFIPDPFSSSGGKRVYRSGDVARYRADGTIEYLGRKDDQVKLRGFRIELGEVEAALRQHAEVREAVVLIRQEEDGGDKRLVAYVVAEREESLTLTELRTFLKQWLPEHMLPSQLVLLSELPLTSNGKIDKRALPDPEPGTASNAGHLPAKTSIEEIVANIWAEVVGVDQVRVDDNFFELGGHSLLATRIISRVRDAFRVELPVRSLFESSTVAEFAKQIEIGLRGAANMRKPPIRIPSRDPAFPLSFAQQRLWFIDQLEPGSAFSTIPIAFRLTGELNVPALTRAFDEIVRRHEALRTTFAVIEGQPRQIIHEPFAFNLPLIDLRQLNEVERDAETERITNVEIQRPFNLQRGPLLRASLIRLRDDEHISLVMIHHIISDGWSLDVLIRELTQTYAAFSEGKDSPLPELPFQYVDFAVWQRDWLRGEMLDSQLAYWKTQLAGEISALELPTDRPRPTVQTYRGDEESVALEEELTQRVKKFSRQHGVTLFISLLTAFKALLFRYTGQNHIIVGTPIANRTQAETEGLIGLFINTLALSAKLSGEMSAQSLLNQVREVTLGAHTHQDLPLERLIDELQLERTRSRTPLFQVMFTVQNVVKQEFLLPGLSLTPVRSENKTSKFDIELSVVETPETLVCAIRYNTDLFDASRITRMLGHYQTLLDAIVSNPLQRLDELPVVTDGERRQLLLELNDTDIEFQESSSLVEQFELQVERAPEALAVVFQEERLTYAELNERANQLAHRLRELGVGPDILTAVCMERSVNVVVALLGILKAGGAYLPLDPKYPEERLRYMIEDAGVAVVLTHEHFTQIGKQPRENPRIKVQPENLVYVIYTSGSTGQPKGVMINHGSLLNMIHYRQREYPMSPADQVSQFAAVTFDEAVWELWPALCVGACVHIVPDEVRALLVRFPEWMSEAGITIGYAPTPVTEQVLGQPWPAASSLRVLSTGGDQLHLYRGELDFAVVNIYGPTEVTVLCTAAAVARRPRVDGELPPIGKPIANTQVYVLDGWQQPVPFGVIGELYVGGAGLARGYLGRPELTAEKFVPDGVSGREGMRLYRTGDRVRYRTDGQLEFLGQVDQQVKLRGFRIELGEIEAALRKHPLIRESVVVAHQKNGSDKRLVAYVTGQLSESNPPWDELQDFVRRKLPDYMVPASFTVLSELPLTINGKVDRKRLPPPRQAAVTRKNNYVAPHDPLSQLLATMWKEILGLDVVGIEDDFFSVGGNSIRGAIFINQLREKLGEVVPVVAIFKDPTIDGLARYLKQAHGAAVEGVTGISSTQIVSEKTESWSPLVEIQKGDGRPPLFLVHPVGGNVFSYFNLARQLGSEYTIYGLQARGLDNGETAQTRIEDMAASYIEAIRSIEPAGPYQLAGWSMGGLIAFEMARQLSLQRNEIGFLALIDPADPAAVDTLADDHVALLIHFAIDLGLTLDHLTRPLDELLQLDLDDQLTYLLELAKSAGIVPDETSVVYLRRLFHVFESNVRAVKSYRPGVYSGEITLLSARERPVSPLDPKVTWSALALGGVEARVIPGNHYSILKAPHLQTLAEELKGCYRATD